MLNLQDKSDPKGYSYKIDGNLYCNYASGGSVFSNGTVSDQIKVDSQLCGSTYTIARGSPLFNPAVNFLPIIGGWGPAGSLIPDTATASPP